MNNKFINNGVNLLNTKNKKTKIESQIEKLKQQLTPVANKEQPVFGRLKGKIKMSPDFNAPLDDFKEYMYT